MRNDRVFIASPSEAQEYRASVMTGIDLWNELFAAERSVRFEGRDWERVVLVPAEGMTVQEHISRQEVDRSQLVVAIFGSTAADENTLKEIARARAAGKPVLIYKLKHAKADHNLDRHIRALFADGPGVGQFDSHAELAADVVRGLSMIVGSPPLVARVPTESEAESISKQLADLSDGDRVVVVGRTCVSWLRRDSAIDTLLAAVNRGVNVTFIVQDLHDSLADPDFAKLRVIWPTLRTALRRC